MWCWLGSKLPLGLERKEDLTGGKGGGRHIWVEPDQAASLAKIGEQSFLGSMNSNYKGVSLEGSRQFI